MKTLTVTRAIFADVALPYRVAVLGHAGTIRVSIPATPWQGYKARHPWTMRLPFVKKVRYVDFDLKGRVLYPEALMDPPEALGPTVTFTLNRQSDYFCDEAPFDATQAIVELDATSPTARLRPLWLPEETFYALVEEAEKSGVSPSVLAGRRLGLTVR